MTQTRKVIPSLVKDQKLIQKRRDQIVEAAVQLFIHKGFHKTTTREIARASGFSIGTLYEYIGSKEDVLYLVCDAIHTKVEKRIEAASAEYQSGVEALKSMIKNYIYVIDQMQDEVLLIYQETKSLPEDMLRYVLRKEEEITAIFADILKKAGQDRTIAIDETNVRLMAHNIVIFGQMWAFRRWALSHHYTLTEYAEKQASMLLRELH